MHVRFRLITDIFVVNISVYGESVFNIDCFRNIIVERWFGGLLFKSLYCLCISLHYYAISGILFYIVSVSKEIKRICSPGASILLSLCHERDSFNFWAVVLAENKTTNMPSSNKSNKLCRTVWKKIKKQHF